MEPQACPILGEQVWCHRRALRIAYVMSNEHCYPITVLSWDKLVGVSLLSGHNDDNRALPRLLTAHLGSSGIMRILARSSNTAFRLSLESTKPCQPIFLLLSILRFRGPALANVPSRNPKTRSTSVNSFCRRSCF